MTQPLIQLGETAVDLVAHEVRRGPDTIALSHNEVALLQHLLQSEGAPVTRQELHEQVFGYAPQVVSRAADYAVHRLRRKLETDPSAPIHLLTVPGVGFRLVVETPAAEPAATSLGSHNLPPDMTSFVGREHDLQALLDLLDGPARLVSLVGPGGAGKTRLALRVAHDRHARGGPTSWFCSLEKANDTPGFCSATAESLGLDSSANEPSVARLGGALAARGPLLLILDNLEQVVEVAASACNAWLQAAPDLRILTTSRERLRAAGEQVWAVAPLPPDEGVALFTARAQLALPDFPDRSDQDVGVLEALVERLDGLPLAIELAAARCAVFSPAQLLARLEERGDPGRAPRGSPKRQSTLEQAVDWSWQLLSAEARQALSELTTFPAGFTISDAEAVLLARPPGPAVVDLVQELWEKSLLRALPDRGGRRFDLLRTVRDFAESRAGDLSACWVRHAEWVASQVVAPADALLSAHDTTAFATLSSFHDDLRAALTRLVELDTDPELLAELVIAAHATWHRSGPTSAYFELIERAIDPRLAGPVQARLRLVAVHMSVRSGNHPPGPGPDWQAILALVGNDAPLRCHALLLRAALLGRRGQVDDASTILDQVADMLSGQPPGPFHVRLELVAGSVAADQGRLEDARSTMLRGLSLCERAGVPSQETVFFLNLSVIEGRRGNRMEQAREARRALLRAREVGDPRFERLALSSLANAEAELGALDRSAHHSADALALCIQAHDESVAHHTLMDLVEIDFARGELDEALQHLWRARHHFPLPHPTWAPARLDAWDAMVSWARWGSASVACDTLARAAATLRSRSASMPHAAVYFDAKVLAARAYLEEDTTDELSAAFDLLEEEAAAAGRPDQLRALALDRAHLRLARAVRAMARNEDASSELASVAAQMQADASRPWSAGGLGAACCRVLLASVMAEAEHGHPSDVSSVRGEAG